MKKAPQLVYLSIIFCFLISGAAGLIYQTVWMRYLSVFLGHTSHAVLAVLVVFMGGLALGNAWFGIRADKTKRPLAVYGWLEIIIAVYAIFFPVYDQICHQAYISLAQKFNTSGTVGLLLKVLFSTLTIFLPTVLMGATFPMLVKFVTRSLAELKGRVSALYAINSAGAVVGCLIADFWAIPTIGLDATVYLGAFLNLVAGVVSLLISRAVGEGTLPQETVAEPVLTKEIKFSREDVNLAIFGIGLSGFVAMLYEVVWTRILALALGSSTHAFSLMLTTFIFGIAVGAYLIYRMPNLKNSLRAFGWAELALAGTLLVSMFFYHLLPYWFVRAASVIVRHPDTYILYGIIQGFICFGVMLIPSICLGMTLPLVSKAVSEEMASTGRSVGKVFAVNTLGTVFGTVITGIVLMPYLGLARTLAVGIGLNAMLGILILVKQRKLVWALSPVVIAAFVWWSGFQFNSKWHAALNSGIWRGTSPTTQADFLDILEKNVPVFVRDGAGSTVAILKYGEAIALKVNGKTDASNGADVSTQLLAGHIPMLLRPESRNALVIGLGSGMTCGAIARHPTITNIDLVEISPEVIEANSYFTTYNDGVLTNPVLKVHIEDAKSFLQITRDSYDIIVSEPSNPWMAGVAGVFSREYYEACKQRLRPGGLMAQWVQMYETSDEVLQMVFRTFSSTFPHFTVWKTGSGDLLLVGKTEPFSVDLEASQVRYGLPQIKADLARFSCTSFASFLCAQILSEHNALAVAPPGRIHSDAFPILEYLSQEAFFVKRSIVQVEMLDEKFHRNGELLLNQYLTKHQLTVADFKSISLLFMDQKILQPDIFRSMLYSWQIKDSQALIPWEMMQRTISGSFDHELFKDRMQSQQDLFLRAASTNVEPLRLLSGLSLQVYRLQSTVFHQPDPSNCMLLINKLLELDPKNRRTYHLHLAEIAWDLREEERFFHHATEGLDQNIDVYGPLDFTADPGAPYWVLSRMLETFYRQRRLTEARTLLPIAQTYLALKGPGSTMLDLTCRKIEIALASFEARNQAPPSK